MNSGFQGDYFGPTHPGGCFLLVDSRGNIKADRQVRLDIEGYETWLCEYLGEYLRLQRRYPNAGASRKLTIPLEGTRIGSAQPAVACKANCRVSQTRSSEIPLFPHGTVNSHSVCPKASTLTETKSSKFSSPQACLTIRRDLRKSGRHSTLWDRRACGWPRGLMRLLT